MEVVAVSDCRPTAKMDHENDDEVAAAAGLGVPSTPPQPPQTYENIYDDDDDATTTSTNDSEDGERSNATAAAAAAAAMTIKGGKQKKKKLHRKRRRRNSSSSSSGDDDEEEESDDAVRRRRRRKKKKVTTATAKKGKRTAVAAEPSSSLDNFVLQALEKEKQKKLETYKTNLLSLLSLDTSEAGVLDNLTAPHKKKTAPVSADLLPKKYKKRIKKAYDNNEHGVYEGVPPFGSDDHKKGIRDLYKEMDNVNNIVVTRVPSIDKKMGLDSLQVAASKTNKITRQMLHASPDKTIPEAEYAALEEAYSACVLLRTFLERLFPYITIPYID